MHEKMFYSRELIKQKIDEEKEHIDFVDCFISGYYEDTSETIFENGRYLIDVDTEENILSNTLTIVGLRGSFKAEPTIRIHFNDGTEADFPCYEIKNQIDVTNELSQLIEVLTGKGVLKLELKANGDIVAQLKHLLDKISVAR